MAMMEVMKEAICLQGLLNNLEIDQDLLKINCDSMGAIYLAKNIYIRFHFVREILDEGDTELLKLHTKENPADMLTKVFSGVKFTHCNELSLIHI